MSKSQVSVIIPVYNREKLFLKSLESLRSQVSVSFEVIIVDDGSDIPIQNFEPQIREILGDIPVFIFRQKNSGAPAARNKGFELSKCEFVIFWDADIFAHPEMLKKMYIALEQNPKASFVYSNFYFGRHKMKAKKFDAESLQKTNYITTTSLLRRGDVIPFDTSLKRFQDWDFWLTLSEKKKFGLWIDEYLFTIIPHDKGMSGWLPSFAYKKPFRYFPFFSKKVKAYEHAKNIMLQKHQISH